LGGSTAFKFKGIATKHQYKATSSFSIKDCTKKCIAVGSNLDTECFVIKLTGRKPQENTFYVYLHLFCFSCSKKMIVSGIVTEVLQSHCPPN